MRRTASVLALSMLIGAGTIVAGPGWAASTTEDTVPADVSGPVVLVSERGVPFSEVSKEAAGLGRVVDAIAIVERDGDTLTLGISGDENGLLPPNVEAEIEGTLADLGKGAEDDDGLVAIAKGQLDDGSLHFTQLVMTEEPAARALADAQGEWIDRDERISAGHSD